MKNSITAALLVARWIGEGYDRCKSALRTRAALMLELHERIEELTRVFALVRARQRRPIPLR